MGSILFLLIVIILVLWILASCIRIVPQAYAIVVERLGAYQATWEPVYTSNFHLLTVWQESQSERAGCRFPTTAGYHKKIT